MLALGPPWLLPHPRDAELVRTTDTHIEPLAEEMLRFLSVVQVSFPRIANRHPALTPTPEEVDAGRPGTSHVAFGHGSHHCIGAPLARLELRIAYPALLRHFPELRPAIGDEEVSFRALSLVHGLTTLPVIW